MSQANRSARLSRRTGLLASMALLSMAAPALAQAPIGPEGIWYTKDNESIIRVHPCANETEVYCGTLVWLRDPLGDDGKPKIDTLNRDPTKKNKPMLGLDILVSMKAADDHWKGKAYNPEDGKLYEITFKIKTTKQENDTADLRGCILGFLCQTQTFTRAAEVPGGDPTLTADAAKKHKGAKKDVKASAHR